MSSAQLLRSEAVYYVDLAVTGITFGCMYAMMAVGLALVYGRCDPAHSACGGVRARRLCNGIGR